MTNAEERSLYCDTNFLKLAVILMRNDSASYTIMYNRDLKDQYDLEFNKSSELMIKELEVLSNYDFCVKL